MSLKLESIVQHVSGKELEADVQLSQVTPDGSLYCALINVIGESSQQSLEQALVSFLWKQGSIEIQKDGKYLGTIPTSVSLPSDLPETISLKYITTLGSEFQSPSTRLLSLQGIQLNVPFVETVFLEQTKLAEGISYNLEHYGLITLIKNCHVLDTAAVMKATNYSYGFSSKLIAEKSDAGFASYCSYPRTFYKRWVFVPEQSASLFHPRLVLDNPFPDVEAIAENSISQYMQLFGKTVDVPNNLFFSIGKIRYCLKNELDQLLGNNNVQITYSVVSSPDPLVAILQKTALVDVNVLTLNTSNLKNAESAHRVIRRNKAFVEFQVPNKDPLRGPKKYVLLVPHGTAHHVHSQFVLNDRNFKDISVVSLEHAAAYLAKKSYTSPIPDLPVVRLPGFGDAYLKEHLDWLVERAAPHISYKIKNTETGCILKDVVLVDTPFLREHLPDAQESDAKILSQFLSRASKKGLVSFMGSVNGVEMGPKKRYDIVPKGYSHLLHKALRISPTEYKNLDLVLRSLHPEVHLPVITFSGKEYYLKSDIEASQAAPTQISYTIRQTDEGPVLDDVYVLERSTVSKAIGCSLQYSSDLLHKAIQRGFASFFEGKKTIVLVPSSFVSLFHRNLDTAHLQPQSLSLIPSSSIENYLLQHGVSSFIGVEPHIQDYFVRSSIDRQFSIR